MVWTRSHCRTGRKCPRGRGGVVSSYFISPEEFGVRRTARKEFVGGSPEENARITKEVLQGRKGPETGHRVSECRPCNGRRPKSENTQGRIPPCSTDDRLRGCGREVGSPHRLYQASLITPMILDRILEHKRAELRHKQSRSYLANLKAAIRDASPALGFAVTLDATKPPASPALIAEIKKASPSSWAFTRGIFGTVRLSGLGAHVP